MNNAASKANAAFNFTLTRADKGNGVLQATQVITKDGQVVTDIKFNNCYKPPRTGDHGMMNWLIMSLLSFVGIIVLRRKYVKFNEC